MKICIVTVHDSINSGSYWQAFALGRTLEKMGHEAVYLRRSAYGQSLRSKQYLLKNLVGNFVFQGIREGFRHLRMLNDFRKTRRGRQETGMSPAEIKGIDCFILGSDTIWNLESGHFRRNKDVFLGKPFLSKKVFPYAASAANTPLKSFREIEGLEQIIRQWQAIGVRDEHTRDIIAAFTDREIVKVCDPTLLLEKADYLPLSRSVDTEKYIFLYLFKGLSKEHVQELSAFAREKGLKIVLGTMIDPGLQCDKKVVNSPQAFLSYMLHADYVVTDTFHGAIFATNLEKRYAAIGRGKVKVNQFLEEMQLSDRLAGESASPAEILAREIDYDRVRENIRRSRDFSLNYLKNALGE